MPVILVGCVDPRLRHIVGAMSTEFAASNRFTCLSAMILATALWGASGGAIAGTHLNGFASACVVELSTGLALLALSSQKTAPLLQIFMAKRKQFVLLAFVEVLNVSMYYWALQIAPLGPVMAMHLTAPVILAALATRSGARPVNARNVTSSILVITAIIMIGSRSRMETDSGVLFGTLLALASATALAGFVTLAKRMSTDLPPTVGGGLQMLCSGLMLSPSLLSIGGNFSALPDLAIAVACFAPATMFYWVAIRGLNTISVGMVALAEPVFGAIAAYLLFQISPSWWDAAVVATVAAAIAIEVTAPSEPAMDDALPAPTGFQPSSDSIIEQSRSQ